MDGLGTRGKWKKKSPIDTLAFLCMLVLTSGVASSQPEKNCTEGDYLTENGICCNKCNPGLKLKEDCQAEGYRTKCAPCEEGTYTAVSNYHPNCRRCTKCKESKYQVEESNCTRYRDAVCRCKDGFYKKSIDSETFDCLKCTRCVGEGVEQEQKCTQDHNTVCKCAHDYYRDKNKCQQCTAKNCSAAECKHLCPQPTSTCESPDCERENNNNNDGKNFYVIIGVCVPVLLVGVGFIVYKRTKDATTKRLKSTVSVTSTSSGLPDMDCTQILIDSFEEHPDKACDKASPPSSVCTQEPSNLPDCIPKISELIYTVLHWVPVPRVKELARKLDVPDIEIERAEADHRLIKEAHYQMLKVWADRGCRVGGAALVGAGGAHQQPWLQELLGKLEDMNLGLAAQELEKKYSCQ